MKRFLHRYGAITGSLLVLFASGMAAGYRWGQHRTAPVAPASVNLQASPEVTPEQWSESATVALQRDLGLTESQAAQIRRSIAGPSREIFEERHRASLKIHLRLLQAHDTLARDVELTDKQKATLKLRREQLRKAIIEKFHDLIGEKPDPVLSAR